MRIWSIANQKGGVGKTTTTVSIGGICAEAGLRTLMLDLDPHGSLSAYFGNDPDSAGDGAFQLFEKKDVLTTRMVSNLIQKTPYQNLHLLPASVSLATLERKSIGEGLGLVVVKALSCVEGVYDQVLIDCPPQLGVLLVNALAACEHLVIPVQTEHLAIQGLERILNTLNMLGKSKGGLLSHSIVPVMFDRRTQASVSSLRLIRNGYGDTVWAGKIPIDTKLRDASKAGVPPSIYAPESRAVEAYYSLYKHLSQSVQKVA